MEYFLTTYNKDYKWPVPFSGIKEDRRQENVEKYMMAKTARGGGDTDPCCVRPSSPVTLQEIPPAQCGVAPVGPESKFGQPNTYLRKLYNKYPYLYNILSITPPEELAKIAYADKFQTTYRADYGGEGFEPLKTFLAPEMPGEIDEELLKAVEIDKTYVSHTTVKDNSQVTPAESRTFLKGCQCPASQTVCTCDGGAGATKVISEKGFAAGDDSKATNLSLCQSQAPIIPKPISITKIPRTPIPSRKELQEEKAPDYKGGKNRPRLGKWKTEYKDTISRMGGIIIDKKLLSRWPKEDRIK